MKIYLDLIMILNFFFDFILLLSVSILLRRKTSIYRLILGAFIGGLSILCLFIKMCSWELFVLKIFISILMILIGFGYQSIKYTVKNLVFLYMSSIILGGFLYFLNIEFSYKQYGLIFISNGLSINVIFLIIFSPIIIYIYVRNGLSLKNNYSKYYDINIYYNKSKYTYKAYLDTGNTLKDPITHKPVILIDKAIPCHKYYYIPYKSINDIGIIKCVKVDKVEINGISKYKVLVGILNQKIKIDGIDCLLNNEIMEG